MLLAPRSRKGERGRGVELLLYRTRTAEAHARLQLAPGHPREDVNDSSTPLRRGRTDFVDLRVKTELLSTQCGVLGRSAPAACRRAEAGLLSDPDEWCIMIMSTGARRGVLALGSFLPMEGIRCTAPYHISTSSERGAIESVPQSIGKCAESVVKGRSLI